MEVCPVSRGEYAGLGSIQTGQPSLSFAVRQANCNLGPGKSARAGCITACTTAGSSATDSPCLYLHGSHGQCQLLPLPEYEARPNSAQQALSMARARISIQPCSRTWTSSSGCYAASETDTAEDAALSLEDLTTGQRKTLSLQVLQGKAILQAWVSDTGKAVLVQSSKDKQLHFHLWYQREGDPNSALPKQPVEIWRRLPNPTHIIKGTSLTTFRNRDTDKAQSASGPTDDGLHRKMANSGSNASRAITAGFLATPLGLCCCIALSRLDDLESGGLYVQTFAQPVYVASAAASASWQHAAVPLINAKGTAAEQTQQLLHSTESFEDLDLSHADAGDEHEAGQPQAASILLSWQPEGTDGRATMFLAAALSCAPSEGMGTDGRATPLLAAALSCGPPGAWVALLEAHAEAPTKLTHMLSWPSDILSRAEGPVLAITSRASSIASLHWQPDGKALALMDANGTLAFCSPNGSIISVTGLNQCAKPGEKQAAQQALDRRRCTPQATDMPIMCPYMSADRASARLAILHGSRLSILSVRSMPTMMSQESASATAVVSATDESSQKNRDEYADITDAIEVASTVRPAALKVKKGKLRSLRVLAACVGPQAVLSDQDGHSETFRAQRQHSLPETSPGKSPAKSGHHINAFRVPSTIKTKIGNVLRRSESSQLGFPSPQHRQGQKRPDRTLDAEEGKYTHTPKAPVPKADDGEPFTHGAHPVKAVDDVRQVTFADIYEAIPPADDGASRFPTSPHPRGRRQPGTAGSPCLVHTPKRSTLLPRGSVACDPDLPSSAELSTSHAVTTACSLGPGDGTEIAHAVDIWNDAGPASMYGSPVEFHASPETPTLLYHTQDRAVRDTVKTSALSRARSSEFVRQEHHEDAPSTSDSPTALRAKLRRLKAKWSTLAERSQTCSKQKDSSRAAKGSAAAAAEGPFAVNVMASAPFTVIELDKDYAPDLDKLSDDTTASNAEHDQAAADRMDDVDKHVNIHADSAYGTTHKNRADDLAGSNWAEELGLPAGVNLWGLTVLELPGGPSSTSPNLLDIPGQAEGRRVYLTAPRPVAEAVESESLYESSQLSSYKSPRTSDRGHLSADSHTDSDGTLQVQGNTLIESETSALTSPTLTSTTFTMDAPSIIAAQSTDHVSVRAEEGKTAERHILRFTDDQDHSHVEAQPAQNLTLDQKLSTESSGSGDQGLGVSPQAEQQQSHPPAANSSEKRDMDPAQESLQAFDNASPEAAATGGILGARAATCGDQHQPGNKHHGERADDHCESGTAETPGSFHEPAAMDRGEPTLEENLRSGEVKDRGRWGSELLLSKKPAPMHQHLDDSRSAQRRCSPFSRLNRRAKPKALAGHRNKFDDDDKQVDGLTNEPKQAGGSMSGRGPLERGIHDAEMGGYYLTTPDPLRTDPGFAIRRLATSEQTAQSTAQHTKQGRDPLNWDPVQYISSPTWRMNTLTAFDMLHPERETTVVSDSDAGGKDSVAERGPENVRQRQAHDPKHRQNGGRKHDTERSTRPHSRRRGGTSNAKRSECSTDEKDQSGHSQQKDRLRTGSNLRDRRSTGSDRKARLHKHRVVKALDGKRTRSVTEVTPPDDDRIPAFRSKSGARLLMPNMATGNLHRAAASARADGLWLVDIDCKWGLNRAGRPPDTFWERSAVNPLRKTSASDHQIRLLRVDIETRPQQSLFRSILDTVHSHHATGLPSRSQADGGSTAKKQSTEHSKRDDRMLKELQEIAAALKEMRASGTKHPGNAGSSSESTDGEDKQKVKASGAQQKSASSGSALLRLARKQRSIRTSPPASNRTSETGSADARAGAEQKKEPNMSSTTHDQECADDKPAALRNAGGSSLSHDGQSVVHHVQIANGQIGQLDVPVPQVRATVDAAVQATPVHRRVPVQAVLLSPAPPQHQVLDGSARQLSSAPTELELQALQTLREGLSAEGRSDCSSSAQGKQLRAFTSVRDIYWEGTKASAMFQENAAAAGSSIQASPSPGRQRPIHPSSPQGASWGSRHAQHIGNRPGSQTAGKKEKAPKKAQELQDKELKVMAVQVQQLMASLQDIEALANAVKADAAASSKMVKSLQKEARPVVKGQA